MKVAIAGYGVEGEANYRYWRDRAEVTVVDERPTVDGLESVATKLGPEAFSDLGDFDLIIRSPGVAPGKLPYGDKVWSGTNQFFSYCQQQQITIVGVTGTKGKGTTCSLIANILKAAGRGVHLVGNIGAPALDIIDKIQPGDVVVYELSSFQLWDLKFSPQVAVVLPIEADHLDVHHDFEDYLAAKANIARFQTASDTMVYYAPNAWSREIATTSAAGNIIEYPFELGELAQQLRLPGEHNRENASAAVAVARLFVDDEQAIGRGLASFDGLDHRLKLVGEYDGVSYYDDSISTTPGSAIAAIKSFSRPKVILLGGSDKGAEYQEIIELAKATDTRVIAMGQTGRTIEALCRENQVDCQYASDMDTAVTMAAEITEPGQVVLLSPASASFDQYKNYADRGDRFIAALNRLT